MMTTQLREEIEKRLLLEPQEAWQIARTVVIATRMPMSDVMSAISYLLSAGRLVHIEGKLYVQAPPTDQV